MYTALKATSLTISNFLSTRFQADAILGAFFGAGGAMTVSLATPEEMVAGSLQGLSAWLYRVVRDEERLNDPDERVAFDLVRPSPLPLRLHYLMTPIVTVAPAPETEQVILGKTLQSLWDRTTLSGTDLQDDFAGTQVELNIRLEPMGLQEIYQVWDALEMSYRLSVSYEVTVVYVEAALRPERVATVLAALPQYSQIVGGP